MAERTPYFWLYQVAMDIDAYELGPRAWSFMVKENWL